MSARDELGARQASLIAALVDGGATPTGVDAERVRIQAAALLAKRGRGVAHAEPELAAELDKSFGAAFADYARGRPDEGRSADDAAGFGRYLLSSRCRRDRGVPRAARHIVLARLVSRVSRASYRRKATLRLRSGTVGREDLVHHRGGLGNSFELVLHPVLVLNGQHVVVADLPERADQAGPERRRVRLADGPESPRAVAGRVERPLVEDAGQGHFLAGE